MINVKTGKPAGFGMTLLRIYLPGLIFLAVLFLKGENIGEAVILILQVFFHYQPNYVSSACQTTNCFGFDPWTKRRCQRIKIIRDVLYAHMHKISRRYNKKRNTQNPHSKPE